MDMKKTPLLLVSLLLSACNFTVQEILLLPTGTATFTPTRVVSATPTASYTPVPPTATFTPTPTLIGGDIPTATLIEFTTTPVLLSEVTPLTPTAAVSMAGFTAVNLSSSVFYEGGGCEPQFIRFTALAAKPADTAFVVLFVRFKSKTTGNTGDWTSITMNTLGLGTFFYELKPNEIKNKDLFKDPWVEYQLVATGPGGVKLEGTGIFTERITLLRCTPTPTASPTATALIP